VTQGAQPFWAVLAEFPLFVLRLFVHPRSIIKGLDLENPATRQRLALYCLLGLAIIVVAFSDNRPLAGVERPLLSTFKGVMLRAHNLPTEEGSKEGSWDWLEPVYAQFSLDQGEAKRLWDTLLTTGFLCYTLFASLVGVAVVARIRMAWRGLTWWRALGTGLLGHLAAVSCIALSMVPLTELLICRHCVVRGALYVLLNLAGWAYMGYYTLGDLGERPRRWLPQLGLCLAYGLLNYAMAYVVFFVLIVATIPM
jgi:hypothetical protein